MKKSIIIENPEEAMKGVRGLPCRTCLTFYEDSSIVSSARDQLDWMLRMYCIMFWALDPRGQVIQRSWDARGGRGRTRVMYCPPSAKEQGTERNICFLWER